MAAVQEAAGGAGGAKAVWTEVGAAAKVASRAAG